ncbi:MAG: DNA-formamidopyrimidine glycosylase family protein [Myxococcota bacterium]
MPELPDVTVYVERLEALVRDRAMKEIRLVSPFLLRTVDPPLSAVANARVAAIHRIGKRIVFELDDGADEPMFVVIHLMIAGRLRWRPEGAKRTTPNAVALLDFENGTLLFTEASKKKRASLHLIRGREALQDFDRGGMDVLSATPAAFGGVLRAERHTLKRSLTDPRYFDGIGNAYSDEMLWRAKLSPVRMSDKLTDEEVTRLLHAAQHTLVEWTQITRDEVGDGFPEKVTAFRPQMAVHGKYGKPCPECGTKVQRIVYAENETNYCPTCQTDGKLLADRALSTLLKKDWPKTVTELEELRARGKK